MALHMDVHLHPLSPRSPYFGQVFWFMKYHPEKIPSAIERYQREIIRVLGVLERVLSARRWLVGDKCSVADLSFVTLVSPVAFAA